MARMLGKVSPPWCSICKAPPGPVCPEEGKAPRQVRRAEDADLRAYVSQLWAEDWDYPEDAIYDE